MKIFRVLWIVPVVGACVGGLARAEELKIAAAVTPTERVFSRIQGSFEKETGIRLVLTPGRLGADAAFIELDSGKADAASVGISLEDLLKILAKKNYPLRHEHRYHEALLGHDFVHFVTHKAVGVRELSHEQLKGILSGKLRNWKELDGADAPIAIAYDRSIPATTATVEARVLDGDKLSASSHPMPNQDQVRDFVASTPGAIGFGTSSLPDARVSELKAPPIGRPLILITIGTPTPAEGKLLKFVREANIK